MDHKKYQYLANPEIWHRPYSDTLEILKEVSASGLEGCIYEHHTHGQLLVSCGGYGLRWQLSTGKGEGYAEYVLLDDDALLIVHHFKTFKPLFINTHQDDHLAYSLILRGRENVSSNNTIGERSHDNISDIATFNATHSSTTSATFFPANTWVKAVSLVLPIGSKGLYQGMQVPSFQAVLDKCLRWHDRGVSCHYLCDADKESRIYFGELLRARHQGFLRHQYLTIKASELVCHVAGSQLLSEFNSDTPYRFSEQDQQALQLARKLLISDLGHPPTIDSLAIQVGLSEDKLMSGFRFFYGSSMRQFVIEKRMEKAIDLLANSEFSVEGIAERVGYHSASGFIRTFKKLYGCTPLAYRKG